tara:strand:- start:462 stop:1154 length:693 start_codon:yes stop_codon:yes gene_type:complete
MAFKMKGKLTKNGIKPRVEQSDIINYMTERFNTGRFDKQLGDGQLEKGIENLKNVEKVSREEMVERGYPEATFYQLGSSPSGMYGPGDNIYFAKPTLYQKLISGKNDLGTDLHERAHVFDIGTTGMPGTVESNTQKAIKNIPVKGNFKTSDYMPAAEVFAELLRFKIQNNIDPKKIFTKKDLPELRRKLKKEKDYGLFNINDMYDDDNILRLMNEVASVRRKGNNNTRVA